MPRATQLALALLLLLEVVPAAAAAPGHDASPAPPARSALRYVVAATEALDVLRVRLCFEGPLARAVDPGALVPGDGWARRWRSGPITRDPESPACVRYEVSLGDAAREEDDVERARRLGRDVVFSPDLWLWAPEERPDDAEVTVRFELAPGVSAATPWPEGQRGEQVITASTWCWKAVMALGPLARSRVAVKGGVLDVVRLDRPTRATPAGIERWLAAAAGAVNGLGGAFPAPRALVLVVPVSGGGEPVAFGMVERGGGPTVVLYLSREAADAELPGEWVAVHELSHLALPFVVREDAWLSEGFATYYQNVLRGRAGLLTEREVWEHTLSGFGRGRADAPGRTLAEVSAAMEREHHYMRVYWSGAAVALLADVELRRRSGGGRSLDQAIAGIWPKMRAGADERWTADEVLAALDRAAGSSVVSETAARALASKRLPEVEGTLRALGVVVGEDGRVTFDEAAPLAGVRRAIAQPTRPR